MDLASGHRDLRRFRPGDSCDECNARRWYSDSGFRYCENGHLIESFVPIEHEEEGNYGNRGHTARRQKEVREREARQLSGVDARELFLECLQLLLRKQVVWLQQREKQLRGEDPGSTAAAAPAPSLAPSPIAGLESAVRDLWDLRIRYFHGLTVMALADDDPRSQSRSVSRSRSHSRATNGTNSGSESDGRTTYSSQRDASDTEGGYTSGGSRISQPRARSRSARKWQSGPDERWNVPSVVETLAICYLGGVLLQLPYRIGDFYRWAKNDQIPFLDATKHIPKIMRDRLPPGYLSALTTKLPSLSGGELHEAVVGLAKGFMLNNELQFPGLNVPPILWKWTRDLGLPIDVYTGVLELSRVSKADFCYPLYRPKLYSIDHPDIFLLSTIVLVTKLLYPFTTAEDGLFDSNQKLQGETDDDVSQTIVMDWKKWQSIFDTSPRRLPAARRLDRQDIAKLRSRDAWTLTEDQIDDYLDWHQQYRLTEKDDHRHMLRLFPLQEIRPREPIADETEEAIDNRYRLIQETCLVVPEVEEEHSPKKSKGKQPAPRKEPVALQRMHGRPFYHYREESELPATAHAFYNRAANLAGITIQTLVREVGRLERRWMVWELSKVQGSSHLEGEATDDSDNEDVTMVVDDDDDDDDEEDGDGQNNTQEFSHLYMASSPPA